uniref:Deoxyuridine 5'-triphosphate nucleotidohydrolase n=1 Tax=Erpetoichthys calabaricus TaxID=27687 RepID=A0A8C4SQ25_ERPCA
MQSAYRGIIKGLWICWVVISFSKTLQFCMTTSDFAIVPARVSEGAVWFDLRSAHDGIVPARGRSFVWTDICPSLPSGCYGRIAPRSRLAAKWFLDVGAGVINGVLFNFGKEGGIGWRGDRVAQLISEKILVPSVMLCNSLGDCWGNGWFWVYGNVNCLYISCMCLYFYCF